MVTLNFEKMFIGRLKAAVKETPVFQLLVTCVTRLNPTPTYMSWWGEFV